MAPRKLNGLTKSMFGSKLFWRLYAGYVAIILTCTVIVGVLISRQVTENGLVEIHHSLAVRTEFLSEIAQQALRQTDVEQLQLLQKTILQLGEDTASRLTVISRDGTVIADSREVPGKMDNHGQRPEIIDAREMGAATSSRFSFTLQQQMVYRAQRVSDTSGILGYVRVSLPTRTIDRKLEQLRLIVLFGAGVAALAALMVGFYFASRFTEPLTRMTEVAEAVSRGDYDKRIIIKQRDEVGQLADAINRMARISMQRMDEITLDRNRLAKIFTGMVEGVIAVDEDQKIVHINQAAVDLLHLSVTDCTDRPIWEQVRAPEITMAMEQAIEGQEVIKAQMRRATENEELVVDIYAAALRNDNDDPIGAVTVLHDISELDHLERIRRDFVANASHELKTPITAILGLTETILDDSAMDNETRQEFTRKIHAQSLRLSTLVTDLLALSRLDSDRAGHQFQGFDLTGMVRQLEASLRTACEEKQLSLLMDVCDEKLMVHSDRQAIAQLLDNLVDNALKYTPAGGDINIGLSKEVSGQTRRAALTIRDTGIGISLSEQQRVFERFYRVDKARSRDLGGTGLGLAIVKNIAEQHGGSVSLVSQAGNGATFTVTLPLEA